MQNFLPKVNLKLTFCDLRQPATIQRREANYVIHF